MKSPRAATVVLLTVLALGAAAPSAAAPPAPSPDLGRILAYLGAAATFVLAAGGVAASVYRANRRLERSLKEYEATRSALAANEARFRALSDTSVAGIFLLRETRFEMANPAMATITGYPLEELIGMSFLDLVVPSRRAAVLAIAAARQRDDEAPSRHETEILTKGGQARLVEFAFGRIPRPEGGFASIGTVYDVTERARAEASLAESERKYRLLAENSSDVIWLLDLDEGRYRYVSPSVERLRGYSPEEVTAQPMAASLTPDSRALLDRLIAEHVAGFLAGERKTYLTELEQPRKDGTTVWTEVTTRCERDPDTGHILVYGASRDITERRAAEEKILHMAQHDSLTDLPNRALFDDRLNLAMARARREGTKLALMFLDLDRFKPVNDEHGHAVGDLLLQEAARRMRRGIRASDTVGRIGGDEFVILLPEVASGREAYLVAEKIRDALEQPFAIGSLTIELSSSIGFALFPDDGQDGAALARRADAAMYAAKRSGRNAVRAYDPGLGA